MDSTLSYRLAADALLLIHCLFVGFVVIGLLLVILGKHRAWVWVRNPWFRLTHCLGIVVVIVQAWLGMICPLTSWEMALRAKAGEATYTGAFVSHWLESVLYYHAPAWVFALIYTVFGILVAASWLWVRSRAICKGDNINSSVKPMKRMRGHGQL